MIRLACPSGCAVKVQIPYRLRGEPVRCRNCTAWFRAPAAIEDGGYLEGELLARPGEGEPLWRPPPARSLPWRWLAAGTLLAAGVAVAVVAWGAGGQSTRKVAGKLECFVAREGGKRLRLPARHVRLEEPVTCEVSTAAPGKLAATVATRWKDVADGKRVAREGNPKRGEAGAAAPFRARLEPDADFVGCVDFVIEAKLADDAGKIVWQTKIAIAQDCPD